MSRYLQYLGRTVLPELRVPPANRSSAMEEMVGLDKGDVVLILSVVPYAVQMLKAAQFARVNGASVIAVSDSRGSPLAALSDVLLVAGTASPQFYPSMVGIVAIVETLIALVVSRGEDTTLARIAVIDHHQRIEDGYLES
jgi:DNA-binding MurR/RpiR family transcriptional regulator